MRKRMALCYALVVTAGGLAAWYIKSQNQSNRLSFPVQENDAGTIRLSAVSLERMVKQLLSEIKYIRPLQVRVHFSAGELSEIRVTIQVRESRLRTPTIGELQRHVHTKLTDWTGIDLPNSVLKFETTRQ